MEQKQIFADIRNNQNFKYLFGPQNKRNMLSLLEILIPEAGITDITYIDTEQVSVDIEGVKSRYDLCCQGVDGSKCIVEMQRLDQPYFNYRSVLYATFLIQRQAREEKQRQKEMYEKMGKEPRWNYDFMPVYMIGLLNDKSMPTSKGNIVTSYRLKENSSGRDMNVDVNFIFLHLDALDKDEKEISDVLEMFAYSLCNMHSLSAKPANFTDKRVDDLFNSARILDNETLKIDMGTTRNDYLNAIDWAEIKGQRRGFAEGLAEGEAKGKAEGKAEVARALKANGFPVDAIAKCTGLGEEEIKTL